jgi:hypothetical protein
VISSHCNFYISKHHHHIIIIEGAPPSIVALGLDHQTDTRLKQESIYLQLEKTKKMITDIQQQLQVSIFCGYSVKVILSLDCSVIYVACIICVVIFFTYALLAGLRFTCRE